MMKFLPLEMLMTLMSKGAARKHASSVRLFAVILILSLAVFSIAFRYIMLYEGQQHSWLTGLYWSLTVMTTLGFGDITFTTDLGRAFSILVLLFGILFFMVILPFTFIQHIYQPWLERQKKERVPRSLPPETAGHVLIAGTDPIALDLALALGRVGVETILICDDTQKALAFIDQGFNAVLGWHDNPETYRRLQADKAAQLVVLDSDVRSCNVVFSAREAAPKLTIVTGVAQLAARDVLRMAGCSRCFHFYSLLGEALARRVIKPSRRLSVLGRFGRICIGEAPVMRTPLAGKTLLQSALRHDTGVNVVGVWERGIFSLPRLDTVFTNSTVLVVAGTDEQLEAFNRLVSQADSVPENQQAAIILGAGRVGVAVARSLSRREIPCIIVDKKPNLKVGSTPIVCGDAADLNVLEQAGIRTAPSIIVTTHDDDSNIYLTIYCRKLRPDAQIISRASLDRNVSGLHSAGADLVLSLSSLVSSTVVNLLSPDSMIMLNERLAVFCYTVHGRLAGKTLKESGIRNNTRCSVLAVHSEDGSVTVNPVATYVFRMGDKLYLIGDSDSQDAFRKRYGMDDDLGSQLMAAHWGEADATQKQGAQKQGD